MGAAKRKKTRAPLRQAQRPSPPKQQPVSEMIGRYVQEGSQVSVFRSKARAQTVDATIGDYEFYDRLRRCKAKGYTLGGLFAKRIEGIIASWVFGAGVTVELYEKTEGEEEEKPEDYTNELLADFLKGLLDSGVDDDETDRPDIDDRSNSLLMTVYRDAMGLGDQYIIVNADGSLSVPSPDTVEIKRDRYDYRRIVSVTVTTKADGVTITDEYRADGRTVTIREGDSVASVTQYENLIGRIPVIHIAHGRTGNELYGHSIHEELRVLYDQYDDVAYKMLDGAKLLGNPLLTFAGLEDTSQVIDLNAPGTTEQYYDRDGNLQNRPQMNIDTNSVIVLGKGGTAAYTAPPTNFTADTKMALKSLFLLLLEHLGIPESVWGGELSSARATSDTQLTQYLKEVESWRMDAGGWVVKLCKIWMMTRAITDPQIMVDRLALEWPPLVDEDREIILKQVELGRKESLLTDETALALLDLVENPKLETERAAQQAEARQQKDMEQADSFNNTLGQANDQEERQPVAQMISELRPDLQLLDLIREMREVFA